MMTRSWMVALLLLQLVLVTVNTAQASESEFRRCRSSVVTLPLSASNTFNHTSLTSLDNINRLYQSLQSLSPALRELYQSQCEECPDNALNGSSSSASERTLRLLANKTRAIVLLTHPATLKKALIVSAGLLTSGSRVTIVTTPSNIMPNQSTVRQQLFQHIPCAHHVVASILLTFNRLNVDAAHLCVPAAAVATAATYPAEMGASAVLMPLPEQSLGDVLLCSIQHAVDTVEALRRELTFSAPPGVLVADASFVAGLLLAEQQRVPAILLVEQADTALRHVLGAPVSITALTTTSTLWSLLVSPRRWFRAAWTGLHDRLYSLDLTSAFVALNRARRKLHLPRVRRISDLYQAGGNVLLSSDPALRQWQQALPSLHMLIDPLLPPCIPCLNDTNTSRKMDSSKRQTVVPGPPPMSPPTVLVTVDQFPTTRHNHHDHNHAAARGRQYSRRLLQALELARESIRDLAVSSSYCTTATPHDFTKQYDVKECWSSRMRDFTVVGPNEWSKYDTQTVRLAPDYVSTEETNLLDSLARHQPVTIVSQCGKNHQPGTQRQSTALLPDAAGFPPVLCVDSSWSTREIAFHLLDLWRLQSTYAVASKQQPQQQQQAIEDQGLEGIVATIERIGLMRDRYHLVWQSGWDINRHLMRELHVDQSYHADNGSDSSRNSDADGTLGSTESLFVLEAWLTCTITLIYILYKDMVAVHKFRLRFRHPHSRSHLLSLLFVFADQLNLVTAMWSDWATEQLSQWDDENTSGSTTTAAAPSLNNHRSSGGRGESVEPQSHSKRKRHHPLKKRH